MSTPDLTLIKSQRAARNKELLEAALIYGAHGLKIIPIHSIEDGKCSCSTAECTKAGNQGKHPRTKHGYLDGASDEAHIRGWWSSMYPTANIGLVMGQAYEDRMLIALDIDPRNGGTETLDDLITKHGALPDTAMQQTGGGGEHYLFLAPLGAQFPGLLGPGVEIKTKNHIVMAPSNHKSGGKYVAEASSSLLEGHHIACIPDWILAQSIQGATVAAPGKAKTGVLYVDESVLSELAEALTYLDHDDRETWVNTGIALKELGDAGFKLWDDFSIRSVKYDLKALRKHWATFFPSSTGYQSVFNKAKMKGWINPLSGKAQKSDTPAQHALTKEELARINNPPPRYEIIESAQVEILAIPVPQLVDLENHIRAQMRNYWPEQVTFATLTIASAMTARRYRSNQGDRLHTHFCCLAPALTALRGTDAVINDVMADLGELAMIRGQGFASAHQIYRALVNNPSLMWTTLDYGRLLQLSRRQPSGAAEGALSAISDTYHGTPIYVDSDLDPALAKMAMSGEKIIIRDPAITMFAMMSQDQVPNIVRYSEIGRGALGQMILADVDYDHIQTSAHQDGNKQKLDPALADHAALLRAPPTNAGNLSGVAGGVGQPVSKTVWIGPELAASWADIRAEFTDMTKGPKFMAPLAHAAYISARRIACMLAAWETPQEPKVSRAHLQYSWYLLKRSLRSIIEIVSVSANDKGDIDIVQRVHDLIRRAGPSGITARELAKGCRPFASLTGDKRQGVLDTLAKNEDVVEMPTLSGQTTNYVASVFVKTAAEGAK